MDKLKLQLVIEDKKHKTSIFCTWYNFFWTLNVAALAYFQGATAPLGVLVLFLFLTTGALLTSVAFYVYINDRTSAINKLEASLFRVSTNTLISSNHEKFFGAIYIASFVVLLFFWLILIPLP